MRTAHPQLHGKLTGPGHTLRHTLLKFIKALLSGLSTSSNTVVLEELPGGAQPKQSTAEKRVLAAQRTLSMDAFSSGFSSSRPAFS